MPWKLLFSLGIMILATFFIGFNLENRSDVSLVFYTFRDVPVFVSILFSFVSGAIITIPFFLFSGKQKKKNRGATGKNPTGAKGYVKGAPSRYYDAE